MTSTQEQRRPWSRTRKTNVGKNKDLPADAFRQPGTALVVDGGKLSSPRVPSATGAKRGAFQSTSTDTAPHRTIVKPSADRVQNSSGLVLPSTAAVPSSELPGTAPKHAMSSAAERGHLVPSQVDGPVSHPPCTNHGSHTANVSKSRMSATVPLDSGHDLPWTMAKALHYAASQQVKTSATLSLSDNQRADMRSDEQIIPVTCGTSAQTDLTTSAVQATLTETHSDDTKPQDRRLHRRARKRQRKARDKPVSQNTNGRQFPQTTNGVDDTPRLKQSDPVLVEEWVQVMVSRGLEHNRERVLCTFGVYDSDSAKVPLGANQQNEEDKDDEENKDGQEKEEGEEVASGADINSSDSRTNSDRDALNDADVDADCDEAQPPQYQPDVEGVQQRPLSVIRMDRQCLADAGLSRELVNRVYRCLYVYTAGLQELMDSLGYNTTTTAAHHHRGGCGENEDPVSLRFWKLFQLLNEECQGRNGLYVSALADMSVRHRQQLNDAKRSVESRLATAEATAETCAAAKVEYEGQRDALVAQNQQLEARVEALEEQSKGDKQELQSALQSAHTELGTTKHALMQAQFNAQLKEDEVTYLNNRVAALQTTHAEKLRSQVGQTHAVQEILMAARHDAKGLEDSVRALKASDLELRATVQELRATVQELSNADAAGRKKLKRAHRDSHTYQAHVAESNKALKKCTEQLRASRERACLGQEDVIVLRTVRDELQQEVAAASAHRVGLEDRLRSCRKLSDAHCAKLRNDVEALQSALLTATRKGEHLAADNQTLRTALRTEVDAWRTKAEGAKGQCESLRVPFQNLQVEHKETKAKLATECAARLACEYELIGARDWIATRTRAESATEKEMRRMKDELAGAVYVKEKLAAELKHKVMDLSASENRLKHRVAELTTELSESNSKVEVLSAKATQGELSIADLSQQVVALETTSRRALDQVAPFHDLFRLLFQRLSALAMQHADDADDAQHASNLERKLKKIEDSAPPMVLTTLSPTAVDERTTSSGGGGGGGGEDKVTDSHDAASVSSGHGEEQESQCASGNSAQQHQQPGMEAYLERLPVLDAISENIEELFRTIVRRTRLRARARATQGQALEQMGMMAEEQRTREMQMRQQVAVAQRKSEAMLKYARETTGMMEHPSSSSQVVTEHGYLQHSVVTTSAIDVSKRGVDGLDVSVHDADADADADDSAATTLCAGLDADEVSARISELRAMLRRTTTTTATTTTTTTERVDTGARPGEEPQRQQMQAREGEQDEAATAQQPLAASSSSARVAELERGLQEALCMAEERTVQLQVRTRQVQQACVELAARAPTCSSGQPPLSRNGRRRSTGANQPSDHTHPDCETSNSPTDARHRLSTLLAKGTEEVTLIAQQHALQRTIADLQTQNAAMGEALRLAQVERDAASDAKAQLERALSKSEANWKELEIKFEAATEELSQCKLANGVLQARVQELTLQEDDLKESTLEMDTHVHEMDTRVVRLASEVARLGRVKAELLEGAMDALTAMECNNFTLALTRLQEVTYAHGGGNGNASSLDSSV